MFAKVKRRIRRSGISVSYLVIKIFRQCIQFSNISTIHRPYLLPAAVTAQLHFALCSFPLSHCLCQRHVHRFRYRVINDTNNNDSNQNINIDDSDSDSNRDSDSDRDSDNNHSHNNDMDVGERMRYQKKISSTKVQKRQKK